MAQEIIPAIHSDVGGPIPVVVAGASIGAFNALAITCRYPHLVDAAVCMSGTYAVDKFIGGRFTDDLYFSSPLHFLPDLEGETLDLLRRRMIVLASGSGRWEDPSEAWAVAEVLGRRGSPTGSTTGARPTTTTGRRGGRCCRPTSTTSSPDRRRRPPRRVGGSSRVRSSGIGRPGVGAGP